MTAAFRRQPRTWLAAALLIACASAASAQDAVEVVLDQARIVKLPDRVATIVVGNPLIADVTIQAGGMMVLTGKGYGVTNVIALDQAGAVLMERAVQVLGPQEKVVVVYRGINRESYSCAPTCERRITLGDTPEYFAQTITQTGTRNQSALNSQRQQQAAR